MRGHGLGFQEVCDPAGDVGTEPTSRRPPAGPQRAVGRTDSSRPAGTLRVFYLRPSVPSGGHGALSQLWSTLGPTTGPPPPTCPNHGHLRRTQNPELKRASELEKSRPRAPFQLPGQHSLSREDEHGSLCTEPSRRSEGCCVVGFQRRQRGRERPRLQGSLRGGGGCPEPAPAVRGSCSSWCRDGDAWLTPSSWRAQNCCPCSVVKLPPRAG